MPTPDLTGYNDLTLFDAEPSDLVARALIDAAVKLPGWNPKDGHPALVLLEAMALIVAEELYAVNRLPGGTVMTLGNLLNVEHSPGTAPTAEITLTVADALGHTIPAGTVVRLTYGTDVVDFTTDTGLTIPAGSTVGTVAVTGRSLTAVVNGVAAGTVLQLVTAIPAVDTVALATTVAAGSDPESDADWRDRFIQRFTRLNDTLVQPDHFTTEALTYPQVERATAINDWNAGWEPPLSLVATPSGTGGSLTHGAVYRYAVTAVTADGETLPATTQATIPGSVDTGSVALTWAAPAAQPGAGTITNYKIYRSAANGTTLGLVTTVSAATLTYTSTGAGSPGAAPPTANGTGRTLAGYVTVPALGSGGALLSSSDKATITADLADKSLINLTPRVIDPTLTAVNVTTTVHLLAGEDATGVHDAVVAALETYLSPDTWPWAGTVRLNKLIQVIEDVPGVDYATVSSPGGDVTLGGIGPLATAGTMSVTTVA